jgi:hypothetical protein
MNFRLGLFQAGLIFFLFFVSTYSSFASLLSVGTLKLNSKTRYVLLGIRPSSNHSQAIFNFEELGFHGEGMDQVDPKFLFEIKDSGMSRIFSFELSQNKKLGNQKLPPLLLDLKNAHQDQALQTAGTISIAILKNSVFPISTASLFIPQSESRYRLQAYYLLELIDKALPPFRFFPELVSALSLDSYDADQLLKMTGQALITRYQPYSHQGGIFVPSYSHSSDFFDHWRSVLAERRSENHAYFNDWANQQGLDVSYLGNDLGVISIPTGNKELPSSTTGYRAKYIGFNALENGPKEVLDSIQTEINSSSEEVLPWHVASFVHPEGPIDIADLVYPDEFATQLKDKQLSRLKSNLIGSFFPFGNWISNKIYKRNVEKERQKEITGSLNRLPSYGSALALTETQAYPDFDLKNAHLRTLSKDGSNPQESSTDLLSGMTRILQREAQAIHYLPNEEKSIRLKNRYWKNLKNHIDSQGQHHEGKLNRGPSSLSAPIPEPAPTRNPVILFFIDGLRPEQFEIAAKQGLVPHLSSLFYRSGTQLPSYVSRSLTFPSWSTILTGFEPDFHGVRSNSPGSRDEHQISENFLNLNQYILSKKTRNHTPTHRRLEGTLGKVSPKIWIPGFYNRDQCSYNFMPAVKDPDSPVSAMVSQVFSHFDQFINGSLYNVSELDAASAEMTEKKIRKDAHGEKQLRLVMNWYGGIDEATHYNNRLIEKVYQDIDKNVGKVLQAALDHPILSKATVFLISDHGHTGGYGHFYSSRTVSDGPLLSQTGFNLTRFFSGEYQSHPDYNFNIGASDSPAPKFEPKSFFSFLSGTLRFTYPREKESPELVVDSAGNNMAQIYFKGKNNWSPNSFYDLSNFRKTDSDPLLNIPSDLLNFKVKNLSITDNGLKNQIQQLTQNYPVELFAMPLTGENPQNSIRQMLALDSSQTFKLNRDPILVMGRGDKGLIYSLILTHSSNQDEDHFQYVVLNRDFRQDQSGNIYASISKDPKDDPLHYLGEVVSAENLMKWRTDREWLELSKNHAKPTAIFSISRALTLSPSVLDKNSPYLSEATQNKIKAETPDFVLFSNLGYAFHSEAPSESDHGGLHRAEVMNSCYIGSLNPKKFFHHREVKTPILSRDFASTILNFAGLGEPGNDPLPETQGRSFKKEIEAVNAEIK